MNCAALTSAQKIRFIHVSLTYLTICVKNESGMATTAPQTLAQFFTYSQCSTVVIFVGKNSISCLNKFKKKELIFRPNVFVCVWPWLTF